MERINVTKTFLPPLEEYEEYLKQIWDNGQLTNQGPLLHEFESKLESYLGVDNFQFVSNGTTALQIALKALDITEGEIITTPFTYVATTSAILWERCEPVYVDIDPETFCIDPDRIEASITDKTKAIMAVHVFGNPCDIEKIEVIAEKHNLKVIYDAAHAFGVQYKGKSLLAYGDISICSFHSTKLFHTIEGGCILAKEQRVSEKVELIKRFGHTADEHFRLGINAKSSEFQAAMGLCNLEYVDQNIDARHKLVDLYRELLGDRFTSPQVRIDTIYNFSYFPIVFSSEEELLDKFNKLEQQNIFPRRYFFPSLNKLPYLENEQSCPISEDIAVRVACLPLYPELEEATVRNICEIILT